MISGGSRVPRWSDTAGFRCSEHPLTEPLPRPRLLWGLLGGQGLREKPDPLLGREGGLIQPFPGSPFPNPSASLTASSLPAATRTLGQAPEGWALTSVTNGVSPSQLIKRR